MISLMKGRLGQAPSRRSTWRVLSVLVFAGLFTVACKDATGPEQLTTLTLTPATSTTTPTGTVALTAAGTRAGIDVTNLVGETYAVTAGGGTVNSAGVFTAPTTPGTSTVTVTCGGLTATATITVTAGPLASITVTPNPTLQIGATQQFTAVGRDAFNNIVAITPVWSTTNPPGTINDSTGFFTAGNTTGTFNASVRATSGTIFGTANVIVIAGPLATITVTPNPDTLAIRTGRTFTAVGRDAAGNVVAINPDWSVANGGGTIPAGTTGQTAVFTAGDVLGTYTNTVRATQGTIFGSATVTVIAGPAATLVVTPETTTLAPGETQTFTAEGRDAGGNVVPINPTWTVVNGGGTVPPNSMGTTVVFTAGSTAGTFTNTVRAAQGSLADSSTVIVTAPPPPPPPSPFRMIARVAWTCTDGSITGDIGTNNNASDTPPGAITLTNCVRSGGTDQKGTLAAKAAYAAFLTRYTVDSSAACGTTLTGTTLAGITLAPGVYCFPNAATLTGTLTLDGPSTGVWLFKIGQAGIPGALSGTDFDVVMAGGASACNVRWWVLQASTMTDSNFKGHILAGAGVTFVRGTYKGNAGSKEDVAVTGTAVTACDAP